MNQSVIIPGRKEIAWTKDSSAPEFTRTTQQFLAVARFVQVVAGYGRKC